MNQIFKKNILIIIFSIFYLLIGIFNVKDYGIGIEEHFQRSSGFFWLNFIFDSLNIENFKNISENKLLEIKDFSPNLPSLEIANYYGILFDLPLAFLEIIFNINNSEDYFFLRHLTNFLFFYLSGIFFYKLIYFKTSSQVISFIGTSMYLLAPKIYGNSFFDCKDLFFLSLFTICIYFFLKYEIKKSYKSLIIISLFFSFATSSRIFGLMLPISFFFLTFLEFLNTKEIHVLFSKILIFSLFYILFLYIQWPYMWVFNYNEIQNFFEPFRVHTNLKVFFNGEFFESNHLPFSYIPKWVAISTPILYLFFFSVGTIHYIRRLFFRLIEMKDNTLTNDLWRGTSEKIDFFVFISFLQVSIVYLSSSPNLIKGWTHFLFLHFFIIYFAILGLRFLFLLNRKNKKNKNILIVILFFMLSEVVYKLYIYHPYQSLYFNNFMTKEDKNRYEIDYQSISRYQAIKEIIEDSVNDTIEVATASWTPLKEGISMIPSKDRKEIIFSGTKNIEEADYIYTNYFYEVDIRYNDKYSIPDNFSIFKTHYIDDIRIYTIFKKIK